MFQAFAALGFIEIIPRRRHLGARLRFQISPGLARDPPAFAGCLLIFIQPLGVLLAGNFGGCRPAQHRSRSSAQDRVVSSS
jgi:hypothetical protein